MTPSARRPTIVAISKRVKVKGPALKKKVLEIGAQKYKAAAKRRLSAWEGVFESWMAS